MIDIPMEDFLEHFGVKGMKWGVRRKRPETPEGKAIHERNKKIAIASGAALIGVGAIFLASRNKNVRELSSNLISSGQERASSILSSKGSTKTSAVRAAQIKQIEAHRQLTARTKGSEYANMTPEKLLAKHNASKSDFDRWLTLRERELGYLYKGER